VVERNTDDVILDAAHELLKEHGYRGMTMDEVAARVNLGKGTLYLHFRSKEDLALSCIDRGNRQVQEKLRTIARSSLCPAEKLEEMLRQRVLLRLKAVAGHKTGIDDMLQALREPLRDRREQYHGAEAHLIAEVLVEGRTLGAFEVEEPYETAFALITATNSLQPYSLSPQELVEKVGVEQRIARLAPMLVRSVLRVTLTNRADVS